MIKKKNIKVNRLIFSFLFILIASFIGYSDSFAVETSLPESYKNYVKYYTNNPELFAYVTAYNFYTKKANNPKTFVNWYGEKGYKQCGSQAASSSEIANCFLKLSGMNKNLDKGTMPRVSSSNMSSVIVDIVKEMHKRKVYIIMNDKIWAVFWRATADKLNNGDGGYNNIKFCGVATSRAKKYSYRCIDAEKVVTAAAGLTRIKIGV